MDNFHELLGHNETSGLCLSGTVVSTLITSSNPSLVLYRGYVRWVSRIVTWTVVVDFGSSFTREDESEEKRERIVKQEQDVRWAEGVAEE